MNRNKRILSALLCMALLLTLFSLPAAANELPIVPPHTHTYVYTDNGNGTHTVTCSVSGCTYSATESHTFTNGVCVCGATEATLQILSAAPCINESINLVYTVFVPAGYSDPYMTFAFNGATTTVTDYTTESGNLKFTFTGINPQCMGDPISATLYAAKNGATESASNTSYSVRQYCVNKLADSTISENLRRLLSDMLTYGAAAQQYVGYKTNELVTAGLSLTPSAFAGISGKTVTFSGTADSSVDWNGATLVLRNTLAVRFYFTAAETRGLTVGCAINGRTQTFSATDFNVDGNRYYVEISGIQATEFDNAVTATFYRKGAPVGRCASYSVNTYFCATQNSENANLRALVRALYNYGAAASKYAK